MPDKVKPGAQALLDFLGTGLWMLSADSFPGQFASQLMQRQRRGQPLLARHLLVSANLLGHRGFGCHGRILILICSLRTLKIAAILILLPHFPLLLPTGY